MAKLIVHGRDRDHAIRRMRRALAEFRIDGLATTIAFHQAVLADPRFVSGDVSTRFVDELAAAARSGESGREAPASALAAD